MIKHRFIVSETDYRVFAAIPSESKLLTWKKWRRPPDWKALGLIFETAATILDSLGAAWKDVSTGYLKISNMEVPENLTDAPMSEREAESRRTRKRQSEECAMLSGVCFEEMHRCRDLIQVLTQATDEDDPVAYSSEVRKFLVRLAGGVSTSSVDNLVKSAREHIQYYDLRLRGKSSSFQENLTILGKEEANLVLASIAAFYDVYQILLKIFNKILDHHGLAAKLVKSIDEFHVLKLPADLQCPVGVPFAAYTVELGDHVVVDVVEGHAWVNDRSATETEVRATEIVSQMLVERGLNPKAPTRISVREVDPHHAAQTHEAEARPGPARVRTIKFYVSPPRYLREAAEVILASPRRAHWVVGHWRNQPWGFNNTLRRQTWIKPHIRGLGDAGATTTKVVATPAQKEGA